MFLVILLEGASKEVVVVTPSHQYRKAKRQRLFLTFSFGWAPEAYTAEVKRHYFMPRLLTRGIFESLLPRL